MKLRKLLMCLLAAAVVACVPAISTMAAETDSIVPATEDATQEELTDNEETLGDSAEAVAIAESVEKTETTEAAEEEKEEEKEEAPEKEEITKKKTSEKKKSYTKAELRLLACLISCEAGGEPYAGKLAVGIVVVNREESSSFPNSIKNVIYQKYQFGPARNGSLASALKRYDNGKFTSASDKACIKAAKEALSGEKTVTYKGKDINMKGFLFFSGKVSGARLTIGNHQFK
ncbi:MAG: cell wall hydrolase [Acetivibrio ethanolgignens]